MSFGWARSRRRGSVFGDYEEIGVKERKFLLVCCMCTYDCVWLVKTNNGEIEKPNEPSAVQQSDRQRKAFRSKNQYELGRISRVE